MRVETPAQFENAVRNTTYLMGMVIANLDDARLLADFNRWKAQGHQEKPHLMGIGWPAVNVFATPDVRPPSAAKGKAPRLVPICVQDRQPPNPRLAPMRVPLAEGDGRLYFRAFRDKNEFAYVPVDSQGRPIGEVAPDAYGNMVCHNMKSMAQPKLSTPPTFGSMARYLGGKLYVATEKSGLLVFDPKTKSWKCYGPEQGLPEAEVRTFFPLARTALRRRAFVAVHIEPGRRQRNPAGPRRRWNATISQRPLCAVGVAQRRPAHGRGQPRHLDRSV